jgi:hypothetical protein
MLSLAGGLPNPEIFPVSTSIDNEVSYAGMLLLKILRLPVREYVSRSLAMRRSRQETSYLDRRRLQGHDQGAIFRLLALWQETDQDHLRPQVPHARPRPGRCGLEHALAVFICGGTSCSERVHQELCRKGVQARVCGLAGPAERWGYGGMEPGRRDVDGEGGCDLGGRVHVPWSYERLSAPGHQAGLVSIFFLSRCSSNRLLRRQIVNLKP